VQYLHEVELCDNEKTYILIISISFYYDKRYHLNIEYCAYPILNIVL